MSRDAQLVVPVVASCVPYRIAAITHPISAMAMLIVVAAGFCMGGALLAVVLFTITAMGSWLVAGTTRFRQAVDLAEARKLVERRRASWHERIESENALGARDALIELIALVEEVERTSPAMAARFEVTTLVDSWVRTAIAHERTLALLRSVKREDLAYRLVVDRRQEGAAAGLRCEILERRIAAWDECRRRADRMADEMTALVELVRLLAQRCACADAPEELETIRRVLVELDDEDDALLALTRAAS